jgi:hypothetical protein
MSGSPPTGGSVEEPFKSDLAASRRDERTVAVMVLVALGLTGGLVALFVTQLV